MSSAPPAAPALHIRPFDAGDRAAVTALWRTTLEIPAHNDLDRDIDFCRFSGHGALFVGCLGEDIVATAMAGHDGHRGWLYYVATDPGWRRRGYARQMVAHAEGWLAGRGVPKVNLMIRPPNAEVQPFYERFGYAAERRLVMGKLLPARRRIGVTITYLEMTRRPAVIQPRQPGTMLALLKTERISLPFYRYLYNHVGGPWRWHERRRMSDAELSAIVQHPEVDVYVLYAGGEPAGYAELDRRQTAEVELAYFGLLPGFIGRGLGPHLLHQMVDTVWRRNPKRFWVHTCSLDHPKALQMYQRFGFVPYRQETTAIEDPAPYMRD